MRSDGADFAVFSHAAKRVDLCLFDGTGRETERIPLARGANDQHHVFVPGITEGQRYGFRCQGRYSPAEGFHFDSHKLLLDPYATAITGSFHYDAHLSRHGADTAHLVPKGVVTQRLTDLSLRTLPHPRLIYELNVRGFTMQHPDVPQEKRGTIAALAEPAVIAHLKKIGVDCIELMPIAAWIDERHLVNLGLRNAWGYNPVSFFALEPKLAPGGLQELRTTVEHLHAAGISVILDVVFNHTGESDALGPTLSFRGLDNGAYYRLFHGGYVNDAGTGNTLALDRPHTVALVVASLRHWVLQAGIDGFRFDLATVMGRSETGFDPAAPLLNAISADPVLASRILIAEPWDIGPGGYQLGNFPPHWLEWNDRYRDDVRRFWRGDPASVNALATRLAGSSDMFKRKGKPSRSVNFISAHDGFTLHDLLHYSHKDNLANGEGNRDGKPDEITCAGSTAEALLTTLLFSRGTPMMCAGDEFGRTQGGNNNAYAQDNATTWLNWTSRDERLVETFAALVAARAKLDPFFADEFLSSNDVDWLDEKGAPVDWHHPNARVLLMVIRRGAARVSVAVNGSDTAISLPLKSAAGKVWRNVTSRGKRIAPKSVSVFEEV